MPVGTTEKRVRCSPVLKLRLTLHHVGGICVLFEGRPELGPHIPRTGECVLAAEQMLQVEGVQYVCRGRGVLEIRLLA